MKVLKSMQRLKNEPGVILSLTAYGASVLQCQFGIGTDTDNTMLDLSTSVDDVDSGTSGTPAPALSGRI